MYGVLPAGTVQLPHRHQSVALDLIIDCQPGCYSLVGEDLTARGRSSNRFVPWKTASGFVNAAGLVACPL